MVLPASKYLANGPKMPTQLSKVRHLRTAYLKPVFAAFKCLEPLRLLTSSRKVRTFIP